MFLKEPNSKNILFKNILFIYCENKNLAHISLLLTPSSLHFVLNSIYFITHKKLLQESETFLYRKVLLL